MAEEHGKMEGGENLNQTGSDAKRMLDRYTENPCSPA